jgi:hypothetical protein
MAWHRAELAAMKNMIAGLTDQILELGGLLVA